MHKWRASQKYCRIWPIHQYFSASTSSVKFSEVRTSAINRLKRLNKYNYDNNFPIREYQRVSKILQGLDPSANLIPPKEENHTKCTGVMPFRPTIKATLNVGIRLNVRNVLNLVWYTQRQSFLMKIQIDKTYFNNFNHVPISWTIAMRNI